MILSRTIGAAFCMLLLAAVAFASSETVTRGSGLSADIASDGRVLIERLLYHEDTEETAHDPSDSPSSRRSAGEGLSGSESQRSMF